MIKNMMKKSTLIRLGYSGKIDHVTVEEIGTDRVIHCASLFVSKKGIVYFNDENRKALLSFKMNDVIIISRTNQKPVKDNEYIFLFELKDCTAYKVKIFMQEGYTPFVFSKNDIDNFKAVYDAIPNKLDYLKGKSVIVQQTISTEEFNIYAPENDSESEETAAAFVINNFDYTVEMIECVPVIKIYDADNENVSCKILKVSMIARSSLTDTVIIDADNGCYYLKEF